MKETYTKEEELSSFLKWIEEKTYFFNDKDITIKQVVQEYLMATGESNYIVIEKEKLKEICTDFFYWWYNRPGKNTEEGFNKYSSEVLKTKFGIDLNN